MDDSTASLAAEDKKIWDEIVKKGMLNAITGLSRMVHHDLVINNIEVRRMPASSMPALFGGPDQLVIGVYLTFTGATNGHILMAHEPSIAYKILDLLMGRKIGTSKSLDEMSKSALGEMGNVTSAYFLNAVADHLQITLHPSPPAVMMDMAGAIMDIALASILQERDDVFMARTSFGLSDRTIEGNFLIMPNASFLNLPLAPALSVR
ncbi:MAG: chemotaxis protein CheX [Dehalococcoidia bacterium]|jgi:chemotaxis protein CheC